MTEIIFGVIKERIFYRFKNSKSINNIISGEFVVIDNHPIKKGTTYNIIFSSHDFLKFKKYIEQKGVW